MLHLLYTVLIGFVAGLIARAVTPGDNKLGFFMTAALGIAGSLLATYLGDLLGWYHAGQGAGFLASIVGGVVLLLIYDMVRRKA